MRSDYHCRLILITLLLSTGITIGETTTISATQPVTTIPLEIQARLDAAQADCAGLSAKAKQKLLDMIESRLQAVADRGDLDAVKLLRAAKQLVTDQGTLPAEVKDAAIVREHMRYQAEIKRLNAVLLDAYETAVRDLTKARKFDEAEAIRAEVAELSVAGSTEVAAATRFASIEAIVGAIPQKLIPADGKSWSDKNAEAATNALAVTAVGKRCTVRVPFGRLQDRKEGLQNYSIVTMPNGLSVRVFGYFKATERGRLAEFQKDDLVELSGTVGQETRVRLLYGNWALSINLEDCTIVKVR